MMHIKAASSLLREMAIVVVRHIPVTGIFLCNQATNKSSRSSMIRGARANQVPKPPHAPTERL
jgi:hypothetical protein